MKKTVQIAGLAGYATLALFILASIGSLISHHPLFLSVIRSGSMQPLLTRGDAVLILPVEPKTRLSQGDIVVFRVEKGFYSSVGWIMHRIKSGTVESGYITKGDANEEDDQHAGLNPPIKASWIVGRAVTVMGVPLKIPLVGYVSLWFEAAKKSPLTLPGIAIILILILGTAETKGNKKTTKLKHILEKQVLYVGAGVTLVVILAGSMLLSSQHLSFEYEVTSRKETIPGNPNLLKTGEIVNREISKLENKGFFPTVAVVVSPDKNISFNYDHLKLMSKQQKAITMTVQGRNPGKHQVIVHIGLFLPLIPESIIYYLACKSYWLALIVTSLIPALPLLCYPLMDAHLRRRGKKKLRRVFRRLGDNLPA